MPYTPSGLLYKLVLYPLSRLRLLALRPDTRGVRCVVECEGRVLLIRNTYGPMMWDLPGGGVGRGERPEDAARREVCEEVGLAITGLRPLGEHVGTSYYDKDRVFYFYARAGSPGLKPRRAEVYEEGWFGWGSLPEPLSPEAARGIGLYHSGLS